MKPDSSWIDPPKPLRTGAPRMPFDGAVAWGITLGAFAVGLFMIAVGLGWITIPRLGSGPRWALAAFGLIATLGGLRLLTLLIFTARQRARCAQETLAWRRDYPWPHDDILPGRGRLPCGLKLDCLPLVPGATIAATLETSAMSAALVELSLRGVNEYAYINRVGTNAPKIKTSLFYRQELGRFSVVAGRLGFDLTIPAAAPATRLFGPPLTYWELVVRDREEREAVILLPVYPQAIPQGAYSR